MEVIVRNEILQLVSGLDLLVALVLGVGGRRRGLRAFRFLLSSSVLQLGRQNGPTGSLRRLRPSCCGSLWKGGGSGVGGRLAASTWLEWQAAVVLDAAVLIAEQNFATLLDSCKAEQKIIVQLEAVLSALLADTCTGVTEHHYCLSFASWFEDPSHRHVHCRHLAEDFSCLRTES